jgi:hypothetical protein
LFFCAWIVAHAGCGDDRTVLGPTADLAGIVAADGGAPPTGCTPACGAQQICLAGVCADLPSSCPCPRGAYCDLSSNTCRAGCAFDTDCAAPANRCVNHACICPSAGLTLCGAACTNVSSDAKNCGACGHVCLPGESCAVGVCGCAASNSYCASTQSCVDLSTDPINCGGCDQRCSAPRTACVAAQCACPTATPNYCNASNSCVDIQSDPLNCGGCGNGCPDGQPCTHGACACPGTAATFCSGSPGRCVDVMSDSANCGGCGLSCATVPSFGACMSGWCCEPNTSSCCIAPGSPCDSNTLCCCADAGGHMCLSGKCAPCG